MSNNNQIAIIKDAENKSGVPMAFNEKEGIKGEIAIKASPLKLRNVIKASVMKAYLSLGREFEVEELTILIDSLKAEIMRAFPGIRLEEIGLAIHKGAMGEYEKVYALSLAAFVSFIRSYMNSDLRKSALHQHLSDSNQLLLDAPNKPSQEEIEQNKKQIIINAFESFKTHGKYNDWGNYIFDSLAEYGVINLTEEQKIDIWKKSKQRVINSLSISARSIDEEKENQRLLKEVQDNNDHRLIYAEAKKIALNHFFKELLDMEVDLMDLINV